MNVQPTLDKIDETTKLPNGFREQMRAKYEGIMNQTIITLSKEDYADGC